MLSAWSEDGGARKAAAAREFCTAVTTADRTAENVFIDWIIDTDTDGDTARAKSHLQQCLETDSFTGFWYDWETTADTTELKSQFSMSYLTLDDMVLEPRHATLCVDATVSPHSTFAVVEVSDGLAESEPL